MKWILISLCLFTIGCKTSPPTYTIEEFATLCDIECSDLTTALVEARDYKNALSALGQARKHAKDPHRFDSLSDPAEKTAQDLQLAVSDVVIHHRLKRDTRSSWQELEASLARIVELDDPRALELATTDFVPKQDRAWFEHNLKEQKGSVSREFGGLILRDWSAILSRQWVTSPSGDVNFAHLYLASRSTMVGKTEYLDLVSRYVAPRGAPDRAEQLDLILWSDQVLQPFFDGVTPEYEETLRILVFAAKERGFSSNLIPTPGPGLPGLPGCAVVEPLLGVAVRKNARRAEALVRISECLVSLGHGRLASQTLSTALRVDTGLERALELGVLNALLSGSWVSKLRRRVEAAGRKDLVTALDAFTTRRHSVLVQKTSELPESTLKRFLMARIALQGGDWGNALLRMSSIVHDYRSYSATYEALRANFYAGSTADVPNIVAGVKARRLSSFLRLMLWEKLRRGERDEVVRYAEELMADDKEGSCHDVLGALSPLTVIDHKYGMQRFEDWSGWLKSRRSGSCRRSVWFFLEAFSPNPVDAVTDLYPDHVQELATYSGDSARCSPRKEKAQKEGLDAMAPTDKQWLWEVNGYVWCRVQNRQPTPQFHYELAKSTNDDVLDTVGWSYLFNNEATNAIETWQSIPENERPFASVLGLWIAEIDKTTDEQFEQQWKQIRTQLISQPRQNLFIYTVLADKWAEAGNPDRARTIYEGLAQYAAWDSAIPEIEEKCPTCRTAFEDQFGHQARLWSIPAAGEKSSGQNSPEETLPETAPPAEVSE